MQGERERSLATQGRTEQGRAGQLPGAELLPRDRDKQFPLKPA